MKKICPTCKHSFDAVRSQKTCSDECKRNKYVKVYLTKKEYEIIQVLKDRLFIHSPTLSMQDLFRLILKNIDVAMIEYMKLEQDDPVKMLMFNNFLLNKWV